MSEDVDIPRAEIGDGGGGEPGMGLRGVEVGVAVEVAVGQRGLN